MSCSCKRCSVSEAAQVKFGMLLGYNKCCMNRYLAKDYIGVDTVPIPFTICDFDSPQNLWCRRTVDIPLNCWITENFEELGIREFVPCMGCMLKIKKYLYDNRDDWKGALKLVIDTDNRYFDVSHDPSLDELQAACDHVWKKKDNEIIKKEIMEEPTKIFEILREYQS
jgi:hypothetical protein